MGSKGIRIPEGASRVVSGILCGLAITTAIARTSIRYRNTLRFGVDDALLLFACICLTAATALLYKLIPNAYLYEKLDFNDRVSLPFPIVDIGKEAVYTLRILHAYTCISWLVVFTVKFCFLVFFRALIDRQRPMIMYWRVVVLITVVLGGVSLCETFIACPHIDISSLECLKGPGFARTLAVGVVAKCMDVITDILLITIPIRLLWNVRIKPRQKLGIGAFLCLSIVMVIVAIIKASGIRTSVDSFDLVWEVFWQQIEACTAVLMVSFTAFRSVFISNKSKAGRKVVRPSIFKCFQSRLSPVRPLGRDFHQLVPSNQPKDSPPHVTLGTRFQSAQRVGLLGSQVQPASSTASFSYLQQKESALQQEPKDLESLPTHGCGLGLPSVTDPSSSELQHEEQPLSPSSSQDKERNLRGHWWQIGLLSNFTLSRVTDHDSEV